MNEDNCVLDDGDIRNVGLAFNYFVRKVDGDENFKKIYFELSQKINKLNDLVKTLGLTGDADKC